MIRKKLSDLLLRLALLLNPGAVLERTPTVKKLGLGIKVTKNDVKKYRRLHPECRSSRKALDEVVKMSRNQIGLSIVQGIRERQLICYSERRCWYGAEITGELFLYAPEEED